MKINKKIAQILLAAGIATSTLSACRTDSFCTTEEPIEFTLDSELFEEITEEFEEVKEDPEAKYRFNAILEEYEDGSKLVHVDGEDTIIYDDVVVKYDEDGVAYLSKLHFHIIGKKEV